MLFNAPIFLFGYLPAVLIVTAVLCRLRAFRLAVLWMTAASLAFYCWDRPGRLLVIIGLSIGFNYAVARRIGSTRRRSWLAVGVAGNLLWLGAFKYAAFFAGNLAALGAPIPGFHVSLPIGISFYTFTQIAFLADVHRGQAEVYHPLDYTLFVTFFPHLVAGPIIHHRDVMPQLTRRWRERVNADDLALGLSWFAAGLFKKVVLADGVAPAADRVFDAAARGGALSWAEGWSGALGYALQLYFDFSGYSDMAVGLAAMLGVQFPQNFLSPYKATSLLEFWRRWHITLSRFLRDYLYIPLGGNRLGERRRYLNLFATMVLGGFWHGAGWAFLLWGCLHGVGLAANQAWRDTRVARRLPAAAGWAVTSVFVVLAWVPFRADTLATTGRIWSAMIAGGPGGLPTNELLWIAALSAIVVLAPNTAEIFGWPGLRRPRLWQPGGPAALALGLCLGLAVAGTFGHASAFLYYRF